MESQALLIAEYEERRKKNPRYSLRAFSRDLAISPSMLSCLFKGKRQLTVDLAFHIALRLPWSERKKERFRKIVLLEKAKSPHDRQALAKKLRLGSSPGKKRVKALHLEEGKFSEIARWHHAAIVELLRIGKYRHSPSLLASALGIRLQDCVLALQRLESVGLVKRKGETWERVENPVQVPPMPSRAIRQFHRDLLDKAWIALEDIAPQDREITGVVVATTPEKLREARKRIQEFRDELCEFLEECHPSLIYHLAIQFFPLSRDVDQKT